MTKVELQKTRRKNLQHLVDTIGGGGHGSKVRLAKHMDPVDWPGLASMISQYINSTRGMGEDVARKYERLLGLPRYSFDEPLWDAKKEPGDIRRDETLDRMAENLEKMSVEIKKLKQKSVGLQDSPAAKKGASGQSVATELNRH